MHIYDFTGYCQMIRDKKRIKSIADALKKFVTPETIVLEIGSGTGLFTYLACKFGARKVIAIEPNPVTQIAREAIEAHGFKDKVEFIEKNSNNIVLEERADLLLCDLHGNLPFFETGITTIIDARKRLLKENAVLMPRRETVYLAVAECSEAFESFIDQNLQAVYEYSVPSAKRLLTSQTLNIKGKKQKLLSAPQVFTEIDYKTIESPDFQNKVLLKITKKSIAHGIRAWFVAEQGEDFFVDNSNDTPNATYGQPLFPFTEPVHLNKNDLVEFELNATLDNDSYIFSWNTSIFNSNGILRKSFKQTTLAGRIIPTLNLKKRSEYFVPKLSAKAEIDRFILNLCNGQEMNGDIADLAFGKFPDKFSSFEDALTRVSAVVSHSTD
jgi:type I protein arginine methyltransferase